TIEKSRDAYIQSPTPRQKLDLFTDFLNLKQNSMRYRELSILNFVLQYFQETGEPVDGRERNFRVNIIFANKRAVLSMIMDMFKQEANEENAAEAAVLIKKILEGWEHLKQIFYLNLMRNTLKDIRDLKKIYDPVISSEHLLMEYMWNKMDKK
ncbi:MAG TPA: hypothetical protein VHP38_13090, partial [Ruminiclostridium sp.]|nr:hypothetical protein [Ruminiclostridium sp.]